MTEPTPPAAPTDDVRHILAQTVEEKGESLAALSKALGRNAAYLQQYLRRGTPRRLQAADRRRLEEILCLSYGQLESAAGESSATAPLPWMTLTVRGDALAPALAPGDVVLVDPAARTPRIDGIFALGAPDRAFFRRYGPLPGGGLGWLAERGPALAEAEVIGQVEWVMRRL